MSINGIEAVKFLNSISDKVSIHKKDNTDKFWSYKLKSAKRTEFAFDPKTKNGLNIRVDRKPPDISGISDIRKITGENKSTALDRVFSGGMHQANYIVSIESHEAFSKFLAYYESL